MKNFFIAAIVVFIGAVIASVFYEPLTKKILSFSIYALYGKHADVKKAKFGPYGFDFYLYLDDSKIYGDIDYGLNADLQIDSDLSVINSVYDLSLPKIPLKIDLFFNHQKHELLAVTASLKGRTKFTLNTDTLEYSIDAKDIDTDTVLPFFGLKDLRSKQTDISSKGSFDKEFTMPLQVTSKAVTFQDKSFRLSSNTVITKKEITTDANLTIGGYTLKASRLIYDIKERTLTSDLTLSSSKDAALNLSAKNSLAGSALYKDKALHVSANFMDNNDTKIEIDLKDNLFHLSAHKVDSSNLFTALKTYSHFNSIFDMDADYDLNSSLLRAKLTTETFQLSSRYRSKYMDDKGSKIVSSIVYKDNGLRAETSVKNNLLEITDSDLNYNLKTKKLFLKASVKSINLPAFKQNNLDLSLDGILQKSLNAKIVSEFMNININNIQNIDKKLTLNGDIKLSRVDRFAPVSKAFRIDSSFTMGLNEKDLRLFIESKTFNKISLYTNLDSKKSILHVKALPLANLFKMVDKNGSVDGNMDIKASGKIDDFKLRIVSDNVLIHDQPIKPFKLNSKLHLKLSDQYLTADGKMLADDDYLDIESFTLNRKNGAIKTSLHLTLPDANSSVILLPKELNGSISSQIRLTLKDNSLDIDSNLTTDLLSFGDATVRYDLKEGNYTVSAHFTTPFRESEYQLLSDGVYKESLRSNKILIDSKREQLHITKLFYDKKDDDFEMDFKLLFQELPKTLKKFHHGKIDMEGHIKTKPFLEAKIDMDGYGGKLNVAANREIAVMTLQDIELQKLFDTFSSNKTVKRGDVNATVSVLSPTLYEKDIDKLALSYAVDAGDILIQDIDLDNQLQIINDTQNISLLSGNIPGKSFLNALKFKDKTTTITKAHFEGELHQGDLHCDDCAFRTTENKIAIKGAVHLKSKAFKNFQVALLLENNCAYYIQNILGTLDDPKIEYIYTSLSLLKGATTSLLHVGEEVVGAGTKVIKKAGELSAETIDFATARKYYADKNSTSLTTRLITDVASSANDLYNAVGEYNKCTPFYNGVLK